MNKYQREKAKRMKKLSNLGVGYCAQKRILRRYDFETVDKIIADKTRIKGLNGIGIRPGKVAAAIVVSFKAFNFSSPFEKLRKATEEVSTDLKLRAEQLASNMASDVDNTSKFESLAELEKPFKDKFETSKNKAKHWEKTRFYS